MATSVAPAAPASPKMVTLTIEGRQVTVPEGTTILEAAKHAGILIPHYCYHPGLPVAGVCRMCLVEVEKMPKLAPSCATAATEGQVVHVHSEKSREARKGVLEMLLINHPLDCPICDQSGECELQDYTFQEGRKDSRYREPKRFNPMEDFGGDVLYVANRCILCTRCVRFMDDVVQEPVLNVSERGDRATIGRFEGKGLTNPWSGNVVDLCPVGALLSKDFLNKARAWELDHTASVCTGCSQGCNVMLETRENVVARIQPRPNEDVNKYFMCDNGRIQYRWMNRLDRVEMPLVRQGDGLVSTEWEDAISQAATLIRGQRVYVAASPGLSNETLFLLSQLVQATNGAGGFAVTQGEECPLPGVPNLCQRADRAANPKGAELFGFARGTSSLAGVQQGDVVILADDALEHVADGELAKASHVIVIGTTLPEAARHASVVLPIANVAEEEGTFTNIAGRVQRFLQAKTAPGLARPSWDVVSTLLAALGQGRSYILPDDIFNEIASTRNEFSGMTYDSLGLRGQLLGSVPSLNAPAEAA